MHKQSTNNVCNFSINTIIEKEVKMSNYKNSSLTIRVNSDIKQQAQVVLDAIGLDFSTAMNIYLLKIIDNGGIPFSVTSSKLSKNTLQAIKDSENNTNIQGPYKNAEEVLEALDA